MFFFTRWSWVRWYISVDRSVWVVCVSGLSIDSVVCPLPFQLMAMHISSAVLRSLPFLVNMYIYIYLYYVYYSEYVLLLRAADYCSTCYFIVFRNLNSESTTWTPLPITRLRSQFHGSPRG